MNSFLKNLTFLTLVKSYSHIVFKVILTIIYNDIVVVFENNDLRIGKVLKKRYSFIKNIKYLNLIHLFYCGFICQYYHTLKIIIVTL